MTDMARVEANTAPTRAAVVSEEVTLSPEWQQKNLRRVELARKKNREGLDAQEAAEFEVLQTTFFAHLATKFPRPPVDSDRLDKLEARLQSDSHPLRDS
jgi:hypothetical protein